MQEREDTAMAQVSRVGRWAQSQGQRQRAFAFEGQQNAWFLRRGGRKEGRTGKDRKEVREGEGALPLDEPSSFAE